MALRYLKAKRKQAFISVISMISTGGVALGVMALIIVISVMAGFENHLRTKILGINAHILLRSYDGPFDDIERMEKELMDISVPRRGFAGLLDRLLPGRKASDRVTAVTPVVYVQALLSSGRAVTGVMLRGIDTATISKVVTIGHVVSGKGLSALKETGGSRYPPILIGKEVAKSLGVAVGQSIQVVLPSGTITPMGMMPKIRTYRVAGINTTGMYEYDASLAFISIKNAQKLVGIGNRVHALEIKVSNIYATDRLSRAIQEKLGFPYWTIDWQRMSRNLFSALELEKLAMFIILTLIVLVAAFNIISTLIMQVMEKNQDIAILKALGATDGQILRIFMLNGLLIGLFGTSVGTVGGIVICELLKKYKFIKIPQEVYYTDSLPILLKGSDVTIIAVSAVLICFLATIYPSKQAAKISPSEALRTG